VIAAARWVGDVPDLDGVEPAMVDVAGGTAMQWLRNVETTMRDLPTDVVADIDAWDSDHEAMALAGC
jgi:hypothetical protein